MNGLVQQKAESEGIEERDEEDTTEETTLDDIIERYSRLKTR